MRFNTFTSRAVDKVLNFFSSSKITSTEASHDVVCVSDFECKKKKKKIVKRRNSVMKETQNFVIPVDHHVLYI